MELQWKAAAGWVLLLLVQQTATIQPASPEIEVQSIGPTWITLSIYTPPAHNRGRNVVRYKIEFGSAGDVTNEKYIRKNPDSDTTIVTQGELLPSTSYRFRITAIYGDLTEGPTQTLYERTRSEMFNYTDAYPEGEASGAAKENAAVTYFVISLHLILSLALAF